MYKIKWEIYFTCRTHFTPYILKWVQRLPRKKNNNKNNRPHGRGRYEKKKTPQHWIYRLIQCIALGLREYSYFNTLI